MKSLFIQKLLSYLCSTFLLILSVSCVNTRKATYFSSLTDSTFSTITPIPDSFIQKGDLLTIQVSSLNTEASALFNAPNSSANLGLVSTANAGYLVSSKGTLQFPLLGQIKAEGLTKDQLAQELSAQLKFKELLTDPIVTIRIASFHVTVLGEVNKPATITIPTEKVTLLEAIGLAGDLTIYAKRDNILLVRQEGENKITKRINLNSNELLSSPYYYLKANDVVYIEPNKSRVASTGRSQQLIPILLSALSLAIIVSDRLFR